MPGHTDLKKSSGIDRVYLINYSEKPTELDIETDDGPWLSKNTGYIPSNESIEGINTPEALAYIDELQEKYNREDIPDFWDSRLKGT